MDPLLSDVLGTVSDEQRHAVQRELRDADEFPRDLIRGAGGPVARSVLAALATRLAGLDDGGREQISGWLGPSLGWAPGRPPESAASFVLAKLVSAGFVEPRAILDADRDRRGRALDAVVGLRSALDDDGLVPLRFFDEVTYQFARKGRYYLYFHQFLRRYYSARMNGDFTTRLVSAHANSRLDVRVAIDAERLSTVPPPTIFELDYWWGPKLTRDSLDDPYAVGVTVHGRQPGLDNYWDLPLLRTEFQWTASGGKKWLKVEELSPGANGPSASAHGAGVRPPDNPVLCRYLHAGRDIVDHRFFHLDGAVRAYDLDAYTARLASRLDHASRAGSYRKLFRIDGPLDDDLWYQLAIMFFRQNEMVGEYLHAGFQREVAERYQWPAAVVAKLS